MPRDTFVGGNLWLLTPLEEAQAKGEWPHRTRGGKGEVAQVIEKQKPRSGVRRHGRR